MSNVNTLYRNKSQCYTDFNKLQYFQFHKIKLISQKLLVKDVIETIPTVNGASKFFPNSRFQRSKVGHNVISKYLKIIRSETPIKHRNVYSFNFPLRKNLSMIIYVLTLLLVGEMKTSPALSGLEFISSSSVTYATE